MEKQRDDTYCEKIIKKKNEKEDKNFEKMQIH